MNKLFLFLSREISYINIFRLYHGGSEQSGHWYNNAHNMYIRFEMCPRCRQFRLGKKPNDINKTSKIDVNNAVFFSVTTTRVFLYRQRIKNIVFDRLQRNIIIAGGNFMFT